jgi:flagellar hook-associated protein 3 FlgL
MAITRITTPLLADRSLRDINAQLSRISTLQEQLATGHRVNRPSDDPIDARRAINVRVLIAENEQFQSNIDDITPQIDESATTLLNVVDILQRALELTTQAANETNAQEQLDAIALEIDQLLEGVFAASNARTNGRSIFAGTQTLDDAFSATRVGGEIAAVTYEGNDVVSSANISDGIQIDVNIPGSDAFQDTADIFATLIGIRDDLRAGDQANLRNVRLDELQAGLDQALFNVARIGAVQNRLEDVSNNLQDANIQLRDLLSDKIDADFAETVLGLNVAQNAYEAALNAAGRVLQPSLIDFLR